jgi:hypothetical protein
MGRQGWLYSNQARQREGTVKVKIINLRYKEYRR